MATNNNDPFASLPNVNVQPSNTTGGEDPFSSLESIHHYSPLQSAGLGAVQGATLGFADEGEGAIKALANLPGNKKSLPELYQQYRDLARQKYDAAQQDNPKSFMAGNIGGGITTAAIPGLGELNLAKAAAIGGAAGLGSSKADLTKGDIKGAAIDTGVGTLLGAGTYGITKGIANRLTPEALEAGADTAAIKGLGGKPSIANTGVGTAALDAGAFGKGLPGTAEDIQGRLGQSISDTEQEAVPILTKAQEVINTNPEITDDVPQLPDKIEELKDMFQKNYLGDDSPKVTQAVDDLSDYWGAKLADVQDNPVALRRYRIAMDHRIKAMDPDAFNPANSLDPAVKFMVDMRGIVNDHISTLVDTASEGAGSDYQGLMQKYSQLIKAEGLAGKGVSSDLNAPPGLAGVGAGTIGTEAAGAALKLAGHGTLGGLTMASGIGKVAAETATGQPLSRLSNIASAKAQSWAQNVPEVIMQGVPKATGRGLAASGVQTGIQNMYTTSPQKLQQATQALIQDPSTQAIGNALNTAIENGDEDAKNKVLFAAEQNPNIRMKFRSILEDTGE